MLTTPTLHGIDGCPAGWLVLSQKADNSGSLSARIYPTLDELAPHLRADHIVAIDMPIGMPAPDHYPRACDVAARRLLGSRACCVFSAPCRGVLSHLHHYPSASSWHKQATGKAISCQAFNILPKINQLDSFLTAQPELASFHEIHPEVSFAYMNGSNGKPSPILTKKTSPEGTQARVALIEQSFPTIFYNSEVMQNLQQNLGPRSKHGKPRWALNDLHDALAALWSAHRIMTHNAENLAKDQSTQPQLDATGKIMQIKA
jgi:predicted RNase H-like nuclease